MKRGTIVKNKEGEFLIFLSAVDNIARCAVVEDVFDETDQYFCARVTSLIQVSTDELTIAEIYPVYINQISIT